MEQFLYFTQACGLPLSDINYLNCTNQDMEYLIDHSKFRVIQFTGSSRVG
jgi:acyl-CoA reductase-like NAD-dependent aldehyde dehydrogenase